MDDKEIGEKGEQVAVEYLEKKGFEVLDRNFVSRMPGAPQAAEVDIIAKKDNTIHFIEVKTSLEISESSWRPEDRVDFRKQEKIIRAAELWMMKRYKSFDVAMQIDVIAVLLNLQTRQAKVRYIPSIG